MEVVRSKSFKRDYKRLTEIEKAQVKKTISYLMDNPRHPSLQTHKVRGANSYIEAYVNMDIRLIYEYSSDTLYLEVVGHHDILRRF